ncbi:class I SAM-dependent methyltransferase [soil metagenome]
MSAKSDIAATNLGIYRRPATARWYATQTGLFAAEEAAFALTRQAWEGGDVLDIGIGGGRTSDFLAPSARSYVGVDFSAPMVAAAKARHPNLNLQNADARDLSRFTDEAFDFAFFSYNGIDAVDDLDRALILAEARRVLRPGGLFVFSAHNLDCLEPGKFWRDVLSVTLSSSPVALAKSLARIPIRLRNYLAASASQVRTDRYAIKLDAGNDFASPHYYAGIAEVGRQLRASGLDLATVLDEQGRETDHLMDRSSTTLHYIARKPAAIA